MADVLVINAIAGSLAQVEMSDVLSGGMPIVMATQHVSMEGHSIGHGNHSGLLSPIKRWCHLLERPTILPFCTQFKVCLSHVD